MAVLNTEEVVGKLRELGHNYSPAKQAYKARIAHHKVTVYNRKGKPVLVNAHDVEQHLDPDLGHMYLRQEDAPEFDPKGPYAPTPVAPSGGGDSGPTKKDIIAQLEELGIEHDPKAKKDELAALLPA